MTARFKSCFVEGVGTEGWSTGTLKFGEFLTVLRGPNGSGKTPLLKALMFGLGYPVELPVEISSKCETSSIALERAGAQIGVRRSLSLPQLQYVSDSDASPTELRNEREMSDWFLRAFGIPERTLVTKSNEPAAPYLSVLAPVFWIDQDLGWTSFYAPLKNFFMDQEEEVRRLVVGLAPKNSATQQKSSEKLGKEINVLEERVRARVIALKSESSAPTSSVSVEALEERRQQLLARMKEAESSSAFLGSSVAQVDAVTEDKRMLRAEFQRELMGLSEQQRLVDRTASEVETEAEILQMNEVATSAFRTFCGKEGCGLFQVGNSSFGRRILYLRDQLKDLSGAASALRSATEAGQERIKVLDAEIEELVRQKEISIGSGGFGAALAAIGSVAQHLALVEVDIARLRQFQSERREVNELERQLADLHAQHKVARQKSKANDSDQVDSVRQALRDSLDRWLGVLRTRDVGDVEIDRQLRPSFGGHRFTQGSSISGSTRTRTVLAFHAALLEVSLRVGGFHPGTLIFDAPKQHELDPDDFALYLSELRKLSKKSTGGIQVVVAVSNLDVAAEKGDVVWEPRFQSGGKPRFFGRA